ncbi:MAG: UvrD-helicase domain-containing protein, partial [Candidatus Woesearchaeota archaeon]|nr:UvrD-helicase domain-containing protein [Candidatus Woesearchaeota archaeon]
MRPHTFILGLLWESDVNMGRQLLSECMVGEVNERTKKLRLNKLVNFGALPLYEKKDVLDLIDVLLNRKLLELRPLPSNKFIKVLGLTDKGREEYANPTDLKTEKSFDGMYNIEKISQEDRKVFESLGEVLHGLSDEQKKAVIFDRKEILCIAGAGSGKTRVLTRRAQFLTRYRNAQSILCITFTRKARHEMLERLDDPNIEVETFNSFCEKILKSKASLIYDKEYTVIDYRTKIELVTRILQELNVPIDNAINMYYTKRQLYSKERRTLYLGLVNDLFSLMDYQKNTYLPDEKLFMELYKHDFGDLAVKIIKKINEYKKEKGLRDFTDQITHVIDFFKKNRDHIPKYDHMLVDEFQDVNSLQFELIGLISPKNLFAVGDPRQGIYGWRDSKIEFILDFQKIFPTSAVLELNENNRSGKKIVEKCNGCISSMKLPNLISNSVEEGKVTLLSHEDEDAESFFITQSILSQETDRKNIFVLTRTNKQLEKISETLKMNNIKFLKRTMEETHANLKPEDDQVTLSTIHAIKGLEAEVVYIAGANSKNLPCHASEHPLLESVKEEYDKYEEERRLLYVAMSRAKKQLIINYSGKITPFLENGTFGTVKS